MNAKTQKERVSVVLKEIKDLISSYSAFHRIRPDINGMEAILSKLTNEDFPYLYKELAEIASSELGKVRIDISSEIKAAAECERESGRLSESMVDWYDNEVRATAKGPAKQETVVESIIELVKMVEDGRMHS